MGVLKKQRALKRKNSKIVAPLEAHTFDLQYEFSLGVEQMHSGGFVEAAKIFASCYLFSIRSQTDDATEEVDRQHNSFLQVVAYDCLMYRGACLSALRKKAALLEARANFMKALIWAEVERDQARLAKALDILVITNGKLHLYADQLNTAKKLQRLVASEPFSNQINALAHTMSALHGLGQYQRVVEIMMSDGQEGDLLSCVPPGAEASTWLARKKLICSLIQLGRIDDAKSLATNFLVKLEACTHETADEVQSDTGSFVVALETMGLVCEELGMAAEAGEYFARALMQDTQDGSLRVGDGRLLCQRARSFIQAGDVASAQGQLDAVIQIADTTGDEHLGAEVLYLASRIHLYKDEKEEADECLEKVSEVAAAQNDRVLQLAAEISLSNCHMSNNINPEQRGDRINRIATLLSDTRQPLSTCSACHKELALGYSDTFVLPCRCILHRSCGMDQVLESGTCSACNRHVCGARFPGLPTCIGCSGE
mmetsp:Transcript_14343/g.19791  ORF Transcript_14343/g.19791 Transcript_14343/m.19791 type:complete len:484 (-) Transcript_14343:158-1609(-)